MDESHSDWDPTTPSICLIWHPEFWWVISVRALDSYDMIATSRTTFELLYDIWVWYALKCFIHCWFCFVMFHMSLMWFGTFYMPLISSDMFPLFLICSNYSMPHLSGTKYVWLKRTTMISAPNDIKYTKSYILLCVLKLYLFGNCTILIMDMLVTCWALYAHPVCW